VGIDLMASENLRPNAEHARNGEVWVGEVKISRATGRPVALITAPIRFGNEFVGILGTPIELSHFSDTFVKNRSIGTTGYVYMMDSTGTVLAHPDADKILTSTAAKSYFVHEMLARDGGASEYEFEGEEKIAHFRRSKNKGWTIVATEPVNEFKAGVRTIQLYLILFGLLMLGDSVGAVLVIAGKVSRLIRSAVSELDSAVREFFAASSQISSSSQSLVQKLL